MKQEELEKLKNEFFENIENETISYYENYEDIKKNKKSDKQIKDVIKGEKLNDYFKSCSCTNKLIPILKKTNEYFIKNCEIHIDDSLVLVPIETEIYFVNNWFTDGMCHKNDLQKARFGQLYFHRYPKKDKNDKSNTIKCISPKTNWGGVDICLSNSNDYYLSMLIRSAFIKGTTKLVSGTRNICDKIKEICFDESKENLQSFFEHLEENKDNIKKRNENEKINIDNIFSQPRIDRDKHYEKVKEYELNCLNLGKYNGEYKYKYEYLQSIIDDNKQTFYKKKGNIDYILTKYQQQSTN